MDKSQIAESLKKARPKLSDSSLKTYVSLLSNLCLKLKIDIGEVKEKKKEVLEYVEKLGILIKNKELRTKFASNGWPFVKERFDYSRLVNDMKLFYNELIAKNNV